MLFDVLSPVEPKEGIGGDEESIGDVCGFIKLF